MKIKFIFSLLILHCLLLAALSASDFKVTGEIRTRGEYRNNSDFNDSLNDKTDFILQRTRLSVEARLREGLSGFVQIQDSRQWGEEGSTISNEKNIDLHEGYVELKDFIFSDISLRIGRQEIFFGDHRLVGNFGWGNTGRSFDAIRMKWERRKNSLNIFSAQLSKSLTFSGANLSLTPTFPHTIDLYFLYKRDTSPSGAGGWRIYRYTPGIRLKGRLTDPFEYRGEFAYQTGKNGINDIQAYAGFISATIIFPISYSPRFGAGYSIATGDKNILDSLSETFDNLYPTNHDKYGLMDYFGWKNMKNLYFSFSLKPHKLLSLQTDYHRLWLFTLNDYWYNAAGNPLFSGRFPNPSEDMGGEIDILTTLTMREKFQIQLGGGRFFPGKYFDDPRFPKDVSDWAYIQGTLEF